MADRTCIECGKYRGSGGARERCQSCYRRWRKDLKARGLPLPPAAAVKPHSSGGLAGYERLCLEPNCTNLVGPKGARGRCPSCYARVRGEGSVCVMEDCRRPIGRAGTRGMCSACYQRFMKAHKEAGTVPPVVTRGVQAREDGTKMCTKCKEYKSVSEFYWDRKRDKPGSRCKTCRRNYDNIINRRLDGRPDDWVAPKSTGRPHKPEGYRYVNKGYVYIKITGHHRAKKNGWVREHIVVAEEKYGIKITGDFTVHHKNGDTQDNRPSNLELRVGKHGKHADAVEGLLVSDALREHAVKVLRESYGYTILAPDQVKPPTRIKLAPSEQLSLVSPESP